MSKSKNLNFTINDVLSTMYVKLSRVRLDLYSKTA